jgi:hypothetical protein
VVVAAVDGLFVGVVIHRSIGLRDLHEIFREARPETAVIMLDPGVGGRSSPYSVKARWARPIPWPGGWSTRTWAAWARWRWCCWCCWW